MTNVNFGFGASYATEVVQEPATDGTVVFLATNPDLPGCMAHGATPEEAIQNLAEARELYLNTLSSRGLPLPMPTRPPVTMVWRNLGVITPHPHSRETYVKALPAVGGIPGGHVPL